MNSRTDARTDARTASTAPAHDPLHELDPRGAAEHAHLEALLRCWLRETGTEPAPGPLRVDLPTSGLTLVTEVTHCSPTGWLRGSFKLHWFAADPSVISHDAVAGAPSLAGRDTVDLLADLGGRPDGDRLARRWLTADTLPCKGNLLTRLHGIDEVLAPLDAQSVYLNAPNPLRGVCS
ncbi:hypothetical protein ACH41E_08540 [Streptomyces sp. NPDC020412]|uniref:hypothetical protein n=1 Tax=Streptomyces sp. NPDC020412 TaxID=3365073 RepID=UPI0037B93568